MGKVRVVLVRPETAANVGAIARVIRNTGLTSLALVSPGDWRTVDCWRTAWGAHDVLEGARVFPDLDAALAGAAYTAGLSGRDGRGGTVADVRDMAAEVAALGDEDEAALVFGPEASGLTQEEMARCGRTVRIATHPDQPSLNLSHAVMVTGYEVFRARRGPAPTPPRRATHDEKEHMIELLREGLRAIHALPERNTGSYFLEWRTLFQRVDLTPKEVRLLEHMVRKMIARSEGSPRRGE